MPQRLKWLFVAKLSQARLERAAEQMLLSEYSHEKGWGFLLSECRSDYIEGRFIERIPISEEIIDPYGNAVRYERTLFSEARFRVSTKGPQLELLNPPRAVATFLTQLSQAFDLEFVVELVEWELLGFLSVLEKKCDSVTVASVTLGNIELSTDANAKCTLSGVDDVRKHIPQFVAGRRFTLSSIKARCELAGEDVLLEIRREGKVNILQGRGELIVEELRRVVRLTSRRA